jgi:hypothetical protein
MTVLKIAAPGQVDDDRSSAFLSGTGQNFSI